jgi:hypothetical protein
MKKIIVKNRLKDLLVREFRKFGNVVSLFFLNENDQLNLLT